MDVIDEGKSNRHVAVTSECLSQSKKSKTAVDCLWCLSCTQNSLLSRDVTADAACCWVKLYNISGGGNIKASVLVIKRFTVK